MCHDHTTEVLLTPSLCSHSNLLVSLWLILSVGDVLQARHSPAPNHRVSASDAVCGCRQMSTHTSTQTQHTHAHTHTPNHTYTPPYACAHTHPHTCTPLCAPRSRYAGARTHPHVHTLAHPLPPGMHAQTHTCARAQCRNHEFAPTPDSRLSTPALWQSHVLHLHAVFYTRMRVPQTSTVYRGSPHSSAADVVLELLHPGQHSKQTNEKAMRLE